MDVMADKKEIKFLIIAGGKPLEGDFIRHLPNGVDKIICVDSGAEIARRADLTPNSIIGDMDSISEGTLAYFKRMELMEVIVDREQETTDLEKALVLAIDQGATKIIMACATGNRMDQFLHNIGLMSKFHDQADIILIDDYDVAVLKKESFTEKCIPGERISLIPWNGKVTEVYTSGLKYEIAKRDLETGIMESISNEVSGDNFTVKFKSGIIILIRSSKKPGIWDSRQMKINFNNHQ